MTDNSGNQRKGLIYATLTALLWGFLAIALKLAVSYIDPITVSWFRFFFASLFLLLIILQRNARQLQVLKKPPILALLAGLGLCLNYIGYITGIQLTSPNNAQIIIQSAPLMLGIIGIVFFKEKVSKRQLAGIALAATGFYFFYQAKLNATLSNDQSIYSAGSLYVLLAAFCWVVYAVSQKVLVRTYPVRVVNLILFVFATLALIPWVDFESIFQMSIGMWFLMLFLGLNTLLAYSFLGEAFKYADANKVGMIITLNPLITIFVMTILTWIEVSWISPDELSAGGFISAFAIIGGAIMAVKSK